MAKISYKSIFNGVTLALHRAFPSAKIHGESVKQDLRPGDFIVLPITPIHSGQMGSRAKRSITFDVIYFPTENGGREECLEKAHELPFVLGTITTPEGDTLHGTNFEINIEDDILHFIVSFTHFIYEPSDGNKMESIETA